MLLLPGLVFKMQLFVGGFGKAYGIIGDNSRFLEVSRDNFPYSHLLLAHFEDIPLSNGVFLGIAHRTFLGRLLTISQRGRCTSPSFS